MAIIQRAISAVAICTMCIIVAVTFGVSAGIGCLLIGTSAYFYGRFDRAGGY